MPSNKKRKKIISQKENKRRQMQSKMWYKITHPNEEFELAERRRRQKYNIESDNNAFKLLN